MWDLIHSIQCYRDLLKVKNHDRNQCWWLHNYTVIQRHIKFQVIYLIRVERNQLYARLWHLEKTMHQLLPHFSILTVNAKCVFLRNVRHALWTSVINKKLSDYNSCRLITQLFQLHPKFLSVPFKSIFMLVSINNNSHQ
jgi:hypothetical protein